MSAIFYCGFFMFVTSTVGFIISILTPYWIIKTGPVYRGIFEVCDTTNAQDMTVIRNCQYILLNTNTTMSSGYRSGKSTHWAVNLRFNRKYLIVGSDYTVAISSLAIIASSLSIIFLWVSGLFFCVKNKFAQLRISEALISGTLLIGLATLFAIFCCCCNKWFRPWIV